MGFSWNWVSALWVRNNNDVGPTKTFDDIFSRVDTMYQRDGHRSTAKTVHAYA